MLGTLVCAATLTLGVQIGWQPLNDGGLEYLIQIEPEALDSLRAGQPLESDIDPQLLGKIRSFKITVGRDRLPQIMPPPRTSPASPPAATNSPASSPAGPTIVRPGATASQPTTPAATAANPFGAATPPPSPSGTTGAGITGGLPPSPASNPLPSPRQITPSTNQPIPAPAPGAFLPPPNSSLSETPSLSNSMNNPALSPTLGSLASTAGSLPPRTFSPDPIGRPLAEQHATYIQPQPDEPLAGSHDSPTVYEPPGQDDPPRSWWGLIVALVALSASLTWNAYLVWILYEARIRYKALLAQVTRSSRREQARLATVEET